MDQCDVSVLQHKDDAGYTPLDEILWVFLYHFRRRDEDLDRQLVSTFQLCTNAMISVLREKQAPGNSWELNIPQPNKHSTTQTFYEQAFNIIEMCLRSDCFNITLYDCFGGMFDMFRPNPEYLQSEQTLFHGAWRDIYPALEVKLLYGLLTAGYDLNEPNVPYENSSPIYLRTHGLQSHAIPSKHVWRCKNVAECDNYWVMLELMLHCGANIDPLIEKSPVFSLGPNTDYLMLRSHEGAALNMSAVTMVCRMTWMYAAPCRVMHALEFVTSQMKQIKDKAQLGKEVQQTEEEMKGLSQLEQLLTSMRPLTLLCRLHVLDHIKWMHIGHLPLSEALQNYLRVGDVSSAHPVHHLL